jgi:GNAT superfamily N-acetyltransferase
VTDSDFDYNVENEPKPEHVSQVVAGLVAFNGGKAEIENRRPLGVFVSRDREILGGVDGYTHWQWLYVSHLWIRDELRGRGVGSQLMTRIEHEAQLRGCNASWLDTFSFQAPDFYNAIGYRPFGKLSDFPPGSNRYFLWKSLDDKSAY